MLHPDKDSINRTVIIRIETPNIYLRITKLRDHATQNIFPIVRYETLKISSSVVIEHMCGDHYGKVDQLKSLDKR